MYTYIYIYKYVLYYLKCFMKNITLFVISENLLICIIIIIIIILYVTLDHKTSLKSLGYVCSNSQKYIIWVKILNFSFMQKIIRILSKDHVPRIYLVHFL